jgi:diguanylate cyclase (GGDEF)-like protein
MSGVTLRDEVDAMLGGSASMALSPRLATLYETREGPGRKRHLAMALVLTAIAVLVAAVLDHANAPTQFASALPLRATVMLLCLAGAAAVMRARPGLWEGVAFGFPLLGQVILSASVGAAAPPNLVDRNIVMSLMLFAVLCAVPPLPVAVARVLAVIWFGSFALTLRLAEGAEAMSHNLPALGVGAVSLAIGVALSIRREASRRRDFLRSLHAELTSAELRRMNEELERLMNTDVMTGVANRRRFESDMRLAWDAPGQGREARKSIGLILADVDHFKAFNDCAGHSEGDACLKAIAGAIGGVVRGGAFGVARWGGEEFVVLAPGIADRDMAGLAERVRRAVEALAIPHPAFPGDIVTISVGGAWCGAESPCETPDALLREADRALYAAKEDGRNRVSVVIDLPATTGLIASAAQ